jgi:hypothetical protein
MYGDFVDRIYPIEFEIKDTTDTDRSASYLDLHQRNKSARRGAQFVPIGRNMSMVIWDTEILSRLTKT